LASLGSNPEVKVVLSLFQSACSPILSYGVAALALSAAELRSFAFAYNNIFHKLFKTSCSKTIELCQFFCRVLPFRCLYDFLRFSFLASIFPNGCFDVPDSLRKLDFIEFNNIATKYSFKAYDSNLTLKAKMWLHIERSLNADVC